MNKTLENTTKYIWSCSEPRHRQYNDVMSAMALLIANSRLFAQSFIHAQINENIKIPRHWPLWEEFTGDR